MIGPWIALAIACGPDGKCHRQAIVHSYSTDWDCEVYRKELLRAMWGTNPTHLVCIKPDWEHFAIENAEANAQMVVNPDDVP